MHFRKRILRVEAINHSTMATLQVCWPVIARSVVRSIGRVTPLNARRECPHLHGRFHRKHGVGPRTARERRPPPPFHRKHGVTVRVAELPRSWSEVRADFARGAAALGESTVLASSNRRQNSAALKPGFGSTRRLHRKPGVRTSGSRRFGPVIPVDSTP